MDGNTGRPVPVVRAGLRLGAERAGGRRLPGGPESHQRGAGAADAGWTDAAPAIKTLAQVLPANAAAAPAALAGEEGVFGQMALSSLAGRAIGAATFHSAGSGAAAAASLGGVVEADPAAATIIVIPVVED
jgi:hypothetical protein